MYTIDPFYVIFIGFKLKWERQIWGILDGNLWGFGIFQSNSLFFLVLMMFSLLLACFTLYVLFLWNEIFPYALEDSMCLFFLPSLDFISNLTSLLWFIRLFLGEITWFAKGISIISSEIFCRLLEKFDPPSSLIKSTQFDLVRLCMGFNRFFNSLLNCRCFPYTSSSTHIFSRLTLALWKHGDRWDFE